MAVFWLPWDVLFTLRLNRLLSMGSMKFCLLIGLAAQLDLDLFHLDFLASLVVFQKTWWRGWSRFLEFWMSFGCKRDKRLHSCLARLRFVSTPGCLLLWLGLLNQSIWKHQAGPCSKLRAWAFWCSLPSQIHHPGRRVSHRDIVLNFIKHFCSVHRICKELLKRGLWLLESWRPHSQRKVEKKRRPRASPRQARGAGSLPLLWMWSSILAGAVNARGREMHTPWSTCGKTNHPEDRCFVDILNSDLLWERICHILETDGSCDSSGRFSCPKTGREPYICAKIDWEGSLRANAARQVCHQEHLRNCLGCKQVWFILNDGIHGWYRFWT
jgi:hypothetical protein